MLLSVYSSNQTDAATDYVISDDANEEIAPLLPLREYG